MSCIQEGTVRNIVLGTVVVETSWGENMCQVLVNWHSCFITIYGPRVLVVDEVRPLFEVLAQKVIGGIPLVVPRIDLDWLHNLVRGVSYSHFFGVELHGVVDYLQIQLESGRNAKILEKLPGLNAVSIKGVGVNCWVILYRLRQYWKETCWVARCMWRYRGVQKRKRAICVRNR